MGFPCAQSRAHHTLARGRYRKARAFTPQHPPFHWPGAGGTQVSVPFKTSLRGCQAQPEVRSSLRPQTTTALRQPGLDHLQGSD